MWVRYRFTYGRRRAGPDEPAPPLPSPSPSSEAASFGQDSSLVKYPYITFFNTAEEAARNVEARREANPPYPESECERAWFLKQARDQSQGTPAQATE